MTTPCCQSKIEIHTDPKNARYIIVSGAKQKVRCMPCRLTALHSSPRAAQALAVLPSGLMQPRTSCSCLCPNFMQLLVPSSNGPRLTSCGGVT